MAKGPKSYRWQPVVTSPVSHPTKDRRTGLQCNNSSSSPWSVHDSAVQADLHTTYPHVFVLLSSDDLALSGGHRMPQLMSLQILNQGNPVQTEGCALYVGLTHIHIICWCVLQFLIM